MDIMPRLRECAEDREGFDRMVKVFSGAESKAEMENFSLLYIMDMSYPRSDICAALKAVEVAKGW